MNKFVTLLYNDEVLDVFEEMKNVYELIKDKEEFRKWESCLNYNELVEMFL